MSQTDNTLEGFAHELWATAQLAPGEGILDGADRITNLLRRGPAEPAAGGDGWLEVSGAILTWPTPNFPRWRLDGQEIVQTGICAFVVSEGAARNPDSPNGTYTTLAAAKAAFAACGAAVKAPEWNEPGHVCPETLRVAVTVAEAYARADFCDRYFFWYSPEAAAMGTECWALLDGIDADQGTPPTQFSLDFVIGASRKVTGETVVYMQRTRAEREAVRQHVRFARQAAVSNG